MLSKIPISLESVGKGDMDKEILRAGIIDVAIIEL